MFTPPQHPLSQVHRCCWTVVITLLFTSVVGIPIAVLIIHNFKNKGLIYKILSASALYWYSIELLDVDTHDNVP